MATKYRIRVTIDDDYTPTGTDGEPLPESREQYERVGGPLQVLVDPAGPVDGPRREIPYAEYLQYWGNPLRILGLSVYLDRECPCCRHWDRGVESLHGIEVMDDSPEADAIDVTTGDLETLPGYLREVARELLREAECSSTDTP